MIVSRPKTRVASTKSEDDDRKQRVASLGCVLCRKLGLGETPAIVHHIRTGQGWMRASHQHTIPLCPRHHQHSGIGLHDMGRDEFEAMYGISELGLLELTNQLLETEQT